MSVPQSPSVSVRSGPALPASVRGMCYRWTLDSDSSSRSVIPDSLPPGLEPLTARLLHSRGHSDAAAIKAFLHPSLSSLHDPSLLPGVDLAAERILMAIKRGEHLVIYGDYDADGVTATAILYHTIRMIAPDANLGTYVPHRVDEGYGLNSTAIRSLAEEGAELIVSVDCGITAIEQAAVARQLGVDLIITDHHQPQLPDDHGHAALPDAYCLVHPGLPGSEYPFASLCGAGVAFKLAWRLATMHERRRQLSPTMRETLLELLGLAALGTVADVVPLIDENRAIVRHGLNKLSKSKLHGLRALIESCGFNEDTINSERIAFNLAPRINACGRLGHAMHAVRLLTEASEDEAREIAEYLNQQNTARREVERGIVEHAATMAEQMGMTGPECRAIVLASEGWHPGVIGIVCSRLVDKFGRPTLLLNRDGDKLSGSGRSIGGFDLHAGLHACREHLLTFGGHTAAAGLSLHADSFEAFTAAFTQHANALIDDDSAVPELRYDIEAQARELTPAAVEQLNLLGPFGQGNPPVTLRLNHMQIIEQPRLMGKSGQHLSIRVQCRDSGRVLRLVGWGWGEYAPQLVKGMTVDAVVTPKLNTWNNQTNIEPEIQDLRLDA